MFRTFFPPPANTRRPLAESKKHAPRIPLPRSFFLSHSEFGLRLLTRSSHTNTHYTCVRAVTHVLNDNPALFYAHKDGLGDPAADVRNLATQQQNRQQFLSIDEAHFFTPLSLPVFPPLNSR